MGSEQALSECSLSTPGTLSATLCGLGSSGASHLALLQPFPSSFFLDGFTLLSPRLWFYLLAFLTKIWKFLSSSHVPLPSLY